MRLTIADLQAQGACLDGIRLFDALFPGGLVITEWTLAHQCAVLWHPRARMHLGWMWRAGLIPQWSMRALRAPGADLSGANLYRADLSGADLSGANLSRADLSRANLSGANLLGADLGGWERGPDGYAQVKA